MADTATVDAEREAYHRRLKNERVRRQLNGKCLSCGDLAEPDRVRCRACLVKASERAKERYRKKREALGIDTAGLTPTEYQRVLRKSRLDRGLCQECGRRRPTTGMKACRPCRLNDRERQATRRAQARENRLAAGESAGWRDVAGQCLRCTARAAGTWGGEALCAGHLETMRELVAEGDRLEVE